MNLECTKFIDTTSQFQKQLKSICNHKPLPKQNHTKRVRRRNYYQIIGRLLLVLEIPNDPETTWEVDTTKQEPTAKSNTTIHCQLQLHLQPAQSPQTVLHLQPPETKDNFLSASSTGSPICLVSLQLAANFQYFARWIETWNTLKQ